MRSATQTSGFSLGSLGDTLHTGYDYLTGTSATGTLSDPSTITLNELDIYRGRKRNGPPILILINIQIPETITIDSGAPQPMTIPFTLDISYSDTLTILAELRFHLPMRRYLMASRGERIDAWA